MNSSVIIKNDAVTYKLPSGMMITVADKELPYSKINKVISGNIRAIQVTAGLPALNYEMPIPTREGIFLFPMESNEFHLSVPYQESSKDEEVLISIISEYIEYICSNLEDISGLN